METILRQVDVFSPSEYEAQIQELLLKSLESPVWQSLEWTRMLLKTGYATSCFLCILKNDEKVLSFCILEKRSIGAGQFGLFCLGGPIGEKEYIEKLIEKLPELTKNDDSLFIQVEPLDAEIGFSKIWKLKSHKKFIEQHTTIVDLTASDEDILASMKPKGRYNVKVAEKHGVVTEWVSFSQQYVRTFYHLLTETTKRDKFNTNNLSYFIALGEYLEKNSIGGLLFASKDGELLAAGIFVFFGTAALYYYGASVSESEKRKYMASYLIQWEAIREAKKRGCLTYDFLGIAPENEPDHHLAGVTDFKLKLSPTIHVWPDARLYMKKPLKYSLYKIAKFFRHIVKK